MYVYVLSQEGTPLMPTSRCGWVRRALRDGKAKVARQTPFTIQLTYDAETYTQEVTLGIDAGSKKIGLSASTEKAELFCAVVTQRSDVKKKLDTRRELRRSRRSRELRYREPRFLNRRRQPGWIPPSSRQKVLTHLSAAELVMSILPVSSVVVESGKFDPHKLKNPEVKGKGYQHGELFGYEENAKAYVRERDGYTCRVCGKSTKSDKNARIEVHHIHPRGEGGSNTPSNLVCLCHECHAKLHAGKLTERQLAKLNKPPKALRDATWMNLVRPYVLPEIAERHPEVVVEETYGYETTLKRRQMGLVKDHDLDAFLITGNLGASLAPVTYDLRKLRCHNRALHRALPGKGKERRRTASIHEVQGFRTHDKVFAKNKGVVGHIVGLRRSGSFAIAPDDGGKMFSCTYRKLKHLETSKNFSIISHKRDISSLFIPAREGVTRKVDYR